MGSKAGRTSRTNRTKNLQMLIVHHNDRVRDDLKHLAQCAGYIPHCLSDIDQALQHLDIQPPHVLLLQDAQRTFPRHWFAEFYAETHLLLTCADIDDVAHLFENEGFTGIIPLPIDKHHVLRLFHLTAINLYD